MLPSNGMIVTTAPNAVVGPLVTSNCVRMIFFPDRPEDFGTPMLVELGLNSVTTIPSCFGFGCSDPWDSARFTVPVGLEISEWREHLDRSA